GVRDPSSWDSTLDRALHQSCDEKALHQDEEDHHRDGDDGRGGHDVPPVVGVLTEELAQPHRHGVLVRLLHERQREYELVPRHDEREDRGGHQSGGHQWKEHLPEHHRPGCAVDIGGLLHLLGYRGDETPHHPHRQRQRQRDVDDAQAKDRVEHLKVTHLEEQGDDQCLQRHHLHDEDHDQHRGAETE